MNLLITGGAGFIGSNFIHYWIKNHPDDNITNYDKLTYAGNLENHKHLENNTHYTFVKGDVCDLETLQKTCQTYDIQTIVHFAAESHVDRSIMNPLEFVQSNVIGTATVMEVARKLGNIHVHLVSTDEVFGTLQLNSHEKFNEQTPYAPHSPYAASKASADHFVRAYHTTYGIPITITNCSNNFGPYMFPEKLFPLAITNVLEGKKIPVYGKGDQVRDWLYVEDHCTAIEAVLQKGKVGETYCIGGMEDEITNLEAIKIICKLLNKDPEESIEYVKDRAGHDVRYAIDWSKIKNELGWQPKHNVQENLKKTVEWYIQNEAWWKRVKSGDYQTYYTAQYLHR